MDKSAVVKLLIVAAVVVLVVVAVAARSARRSGGPPTEGTGAPDAAPEKVKTLPRLLDLGSKACIPCKMMAPILESLKKEYAGRLTVEFVDVWESPGAGDRYGIRLIPTQVFFDTEGKEFFRHEGFFSKEDILGVFREHGIDLGGGPALPDIVRAEPLAKDTRPPEAKCFMCERDIDPRAKVIVSSSAGNLTHLCSPHCYFILESCLLDKTSIAEVAATDYATGARVPLAQAVWLYGADERGRPTIKVFASREAAQEEMRKSGGSILALEAVREREYSVRCGFCDRVMYVQDNGSTVQIVGGPKTYGCCPHCALGVAARLGRDIVVENSDPVSGERIRIETFDGRIKSLDPPTAVAWFGQRKKPDGTFGSAGCFHQWNFVNADNLRKWIDAHPMETGRIYPISKTLEDKMKLSPEQIKKACKIGECK